MKRAMDMASISGKWLRMSLEGNAAGKGGIMMDYTGSTGFTDETDSLDHKCTDNLQNVGC